MAKSAPTADPLARVATGAGPDPELIASAEAAAAKAKPLARTPISRPGLGERKADGRRSGGTFSLKELEVKDFATGETRKLSVPLHMDPTDYPTIQATEAVMSEFEVEFATEHARDAVLRQQYDPFATDEHGDPVKRLLGLGPKDYADRSGVGGKALWLGKA